MNITTEQQAILDQIQLLYQQLKASSPEHRTLQQWFGLVEAAE